MDKNEDADTRIAEGYDIPAVEAWIAENTDYFAPPFSWTRLEGGHSNLTYRLEDATGKKAVIRRPPMGELLPKAHDMNREWSLIAAFAPHGFPVPEPIGFCEDMSVTGALFYVMGFSDGRPLFKVEDTLEWVPEDQRATLAYSFIDTLADMHSLDPDEIGLTSLGKKEDYIGRQIKAWYRSWVASVDFAELDDLRHDRFGDVDRDREADADVAAAAAEDRRVDADQFAAESYPVLVRRYQPPRLAKQIDLDRETYAPGEEGVARVQVDRVEGGAAAGAPLKASLVVDL